MGEVGIRYTDRGGGGCCGRRFAHRHSLRMAELCVEIKVLIVNLTVQISIGNGGVNRLTSTITVCHGMSSVVDIVGLSVSAF